MMRDEIVERIRARHVPCYEEVLRVAVDSGALGVALSGTGPSIIILAGDGRDPGLARSVKAMVEEAYGECGVEAKVYESKVGDGARVEDFKHHI